MIPVSSRTPKRLWLLRPRTMLLAVGLLLLTVFLIDRVWTRGNGMVAGELTPVAPIVQARLKQVFVRCLDHVSRGQRLAEFENEATVQTAAQLLQQLELQLTQVRGEIDIAESQGQAARKLIDAQAALRDQLKNVLSAMDKLIEHGYVAELQRQQIKANLAQAEAQTSAAEFVYQTKKADKKKAELMVGDLSTQIAAFKNSPELNGHFFLTAQKDGIVTECTAHAGEVIPAKTPIFQIFNPDDTFAVVFFDVADVSRVAVGQSYSISIGGVEGSVTGRVTGFYPELSALPASLTRFFWQQETWTQYAPVRLDFVGLSEAQKKKLFAWSQLSASRAFGFGLTATAEEPQERADQQRQLGEGSRKGAQD